MMVLAVTCSVKYKSVVADALPTTWIVAPEEDGGCDTDLGVMLSARKGLRCQRVLDLEGCG